MILNIQYKMLKQHLNKWATLIHGVGPNSMMIFHLPQAYEAWIGEPVNRKLLNLERQS